MKLCKSDINEILVLACALMLPTAMLAQTVAAGTEKSPAPVLATRGQSVVTAADLTTYLLTNAPSRNQQLLRSAADVDGMLKDMLAPRLFNLDATLKPTYTAEEQRYLDMQLERTPLAVALKIIERRVRLAFDTKNPKTIAQARETWLVESARSTAEPMADISHIFFSFNQHDYAELSKRVATVQAALAAKESFEKLVKTYSDHKASADKDGAMTGLRAKGMEARMQKVVFSALKPGAVSDPITSSVGIHIVRLDKLYTAPKKTFEEAQGEIFANMMEEQVAGAKLALMSRIDAVPMQINEKGLEQANLKFLTEPDPTAAQMKAADEAATNAVRAKAEREAAAAQATSTKK